MTTERVRVDTPYPCPPDRLVETVTELVRPLLSVHRVSVGFPGLVRHGHVIEVPSLSRAEYGGERDRDLAEAWHGFDLAHALAQAFQLPTKVVNDADMQGCAVVSGAGLRVRHDPRHRRRDRAVQRRRAAAAPRAVARPVPRGP